MGANSRWDQATGQSAHHLHGVHARVRIITDIALAWEELVAWEQRPCLCRTGASTRAASRRIRRIAGGVRRMLLKFEWFEPSARCPLGRLPRGPCWSKIRSGRALLMVRPRLPILPGCHEASWRRHLSTICGCGCSFPPSGQIRAATLLPAFLDPVAQAIIGVVHLFCLILNICFCSLLCDEEWPRTGPDIARMPVLLTREMTPALAKSPPPSASTLTRT